MPRWDGIESSYVGMSVSTGYKRGAYRGRRVERHPSGAKPASSAAKGRRRARDKGRRSYMGGGMEGRAIAFTTRP